VQHELVTVRTEDVAARAADLVEKWARAAVDDHGSFHFAVSGGHTPWAMFADLVHRDLPWAAVTVYQADERVAPEGDPDRNLTHLRASLAGVAVTVRPMPVTGADLDAAAASYAEQLPDRFDLVHLGLGTDGHTASLIPSDPVLAVTDRLVALTGRYEGRRRMTLTYPALARAERLLWLVSGAEKHSALAKLLAGDESIPAARVRARRSTIVADEAAVDTGAGSSR
jgi:6-phosphogluconolactonase